MQTTKQTVAIRHLLARAESLGDTHLFSEHRSNGDVIVTIRANAGHLMRWVVYPDGALEVR